MDFITLNVLKCLIVSWVLLKFLLWQQHHFCLFQLVPCLSVNLLWCQEFIFYSAPRKKRCTFLPECTDIYIHIQQRNHWKDLNPCLSLYYYDKVIVELATWAVYSVRDSQQITFVILNRFCPLSKLPPTPTPLFLKNKTKLDGIPSKIKWKMHVFWYILFRVLSFGTSHKKI